MIRTKRKFYILALNAMATLTFGGIAATTWMQTASAAPAIPRTATPEAAKADVEYWCSRNGFEHDCEAAKKHLQVVMDAVNERKNQEKASAVNSQPPVAPEVKRSPVAATSATSATSNDDRKNLKQLRDEYLSLFKQNQDLKKAKNALENKNRALNRKNKELKSEASQSCAVASQPSNSLKGLRSGIVPVSGELDGRGDSGASGTGEAAK